MSTQSAVDHSPDETRFRSALLMLGAHWFGTSILKGTPGRCAAWAGETLNPTKEHAGYTLHFREHRSMRETSDRPPLAEGSDWWKTAPFALEAILHAVESEEPTGHEGICSVLNGLRSQELEEPRLCPSMPTARCFITNPNCIHVVCNPLKIARPFQMPHELIEQFDALGTSDFEEPSEELLKRLLDICCFSV